MAETKELKNPVPMEAPAEKLRRSERSPDFPKLPPPAPSEYRRLIRDIAKHLSRAEIFMLVFAVLLCAIAALGSFRVYEWHQVILRMLAVWGMIMTVTIIFRTVQRPWARALKVFYLAPVIPIFFKTAELISYPLQRHDYDDILIVADRVLCGGVNPTVWLSTHLPVLPGVVEYLQICYALFYFLPVAVIAEIYRRKLDKEASGIKATLEKRQLDAALFIIVYGFLLSYISYFFLPSVGPRFTLHSLYSITTDLPGVFITEQLRNFLNRGENILPGMTSAEALKVVTRDAFPSGHTAITMITMILAFRFKVKLRWVILALGSSLIFSTVYLRYHYVVDVLGGMVLAMITLYTWRSVRAWMGEIRTILLQFL